MYSKETHFYANWPMQKIVKTWKSNKPVLINLLNRKLCNDYKCNLKDYTALWESVTVLLQLKKTALS